MGNTESREGNVAAAAESKPPPAPPTPKHLLWGCATAAEHWEFLKRVQELSANCRGAAGLQELGLEYRWVHSATNCTCDENEDGDGVGSLTEHRSSNSNDEKNNGNYHPETQQEESKEDWYHEEDNNDADHIPTEFMVPIGESIEKHRKSLTTLPVDDDFLLENCKHDDGDDHGDDDASSNSNSPFRRTSTSKQLHRKMSTVSLFSLATHSSKSSTATLNQLDEDDFPDNDGQQEECAWRLYHMASDTLITEQNHRSFIAHGIMYDTVARLCMEHAQDMMQRAGNLEWVQIPSSSGSGSGSGGDKGSNDSVGALVSRGYLGSDGNHGHPDSRPTLLILTGTGQVQAGIFSRRHLMTSSIEAATALPFIRQATSRNMDIVVLDPNCRGPQKAMEVVERSLDDLWFDVSQQKDREGKNTDMFILAHSMGGSQVVRYLLKKATDTTVDDPRNEATIRSTAAVLDQIRSLAFTDSNHNINWTKKNPALTNLLVDARSIYIKSHKTHEKAKSRGEAVDDCHFWRHRFGTIKTLWAGTHEHALTNYTGRRQIWNHFDSFLVPTAYKQEDGDGEDDALSF